MDFVEDEQRKKALASDASIVIVEGPAGSGKTALAIKRVNKELAEGKEVFFLGHLNSTKNKINESLIKAGIEADRFESSTLDSFMLDIVNRHRELLDLTEDDLLGLTGEDLQIDFAEIETKALELARAYPNLGNSYTRKFPIIVIDEFQDLNQTQLEFVSTFTRNAKILCFGDRCQMIITSEVPFCPITEISKVEESEYIKITAMPGYSRYEEDLLSKLEESIRLNKPVPILADNKSIFLVEYPNSDFKAVTTMMKSHLFSSPKPLAVLSDQRSTINTIYNTLESKGIKYLYKPYPKTTIAAAFAIIDQLFLAITGETDFKAALKRAALYPLSKRIVEGRPFDALVDEVINDLDPLLVDKPRDYGEVMIEVEKILLILFEKIEAKYSKNNILETNAVLKIIFKKFETKSTLNNLGNFRKDLSRTAKQLVNTLETAPRSNLVQLITIHSAKNREFSTIILVLSPFPGASNDQKELLANLYVACTRARKKLVIYHYSRDAGPLRKMLLTFVR